MANWIPATITERIDWAPGLSSFRFQAALAPYKAGQYATLGLSVDGKRIARPFSYVSAPQDDFHEIYLVLVPEGQLSPVLYALQPGDVFEVMEHSHGFFTLDEIHDAEQLWLIATGTGIAPYIGMLKTPEIWQRFKHIVLVHGVRKSEELTYSQTLTGYAEAHPGQLQVVPFVSREQALQTLSGRIPAALADGRLEAHTGLTLSPHHAQLMLCGNPDMVKDVMQTLEPRGFRKNLRRQPGHITTEKYWT